MSNSLKDMIDAAAGRKKVELVLKNCKIVNVFSEEIIEGNLGIYNGKIVGIGDYAGEKEIDLQGKYVSPGLIDAHVHIESSMVSPKQFAKCILQKGTTTIIADPHEIANVCGKEGIKYILEETRDVPLNVFVMLPSCVPSTNFETSGAVLKAEDLSEFIHNDRILGLGEMMNYPGVISGDEDVMKKIQMAVKNNKLVDGHGPGIIDKELNAYVVSGINTDHECSTVEEMMNKIRNGMYIAIREGSAAKNLKELIKGVNYKNIDRCMFCTDDRHPSDILKKGHIDNSVRMAIKSGMNPISAIKLGSINAANCYGIKKLGAIAPGYIADLIILNDIDEFEVSAVIKDGNIVYKDKEILFNIKENRNDEVINTVIIKEITEENFEIKLKKDSTEVIKVVPNSIATVKSKIKLITDSNGIFKCEINKNVLKIAVIERHKGTGKVGLGLVQDFGLKGGAIASTVAHDSHNLIVIGDNDFDMTTAANELRRVSGGITICKNGKILSTLELPIAGLMSDKSMEEVSDKLGVMIQMCYEKLKVSKEVQPFMTLAFLALPVIPEIRITDKGLFDVVNFNFIEN